MPRKATSPHAPKLRPLSLRTTEERRQHLEKLAASTGRSLAQEVERLVDFALGIEEEFGSPDLLEVMRAIGQIAAIALKDSDKGLDDAMTRARVAAAIHRATNFALPYLTLSKKNEELADAILQIEITLEVLQKGVATDGLWLLADGFPLPEPELKQLHEALNRTRTLKPADQEAQEYISGLKAKLDEAQASAVQAQKDLEAASDTGRRDARAAMLRAMRSFEAKSVAWRRIIADPRDQPTESEGPQTKVSRP